MVDPNTLSTTDIEDFEGFAGGPHPGTNYDGIIAGNAISFAERFAGQTQSDQGDFDAILGNPTDPLTLQVGDPNDNLNIFLDVTNVLDGLGPLGFPDPDAIGEGAVAILFAIDHFEFGIDIHGANDGDVTFDFYRQNGSLIDSITFSAADQSYGFRRDGTISDIRGVLITNKDPFGIGYDNVRYNIPAPGALALLGLAGLIGTRRRRR